MDRQQTTPPVDDDLDGRAPGHEVLAGTPVTGRRRDVDGVSSSNRATGHAVADAILSSIRRPA